VPLEAVGGGRWRCPVTQESFREIDGTLVEDDQPEEHP
jgi:hypothetical protein